MKFLIFLISCGLAFTACTGDQTEITTFILLRHAEKGDDGTEDPDLTKEGVKRAERLSALLSEANIKGIYSTNFKRTRNTVVPLAKMKDLEIETFEPFKADEIERMLDEHTGGTVVLSGHTNNIPWTANLLTGMQDFKDFEETQYGTLLIVSVVEKGKVASVTRLEY